jgi:hypothetical protein
MMTAMQELWEYIEANYNEENFNIFDAKAKSLELEKQQIENAFQSAYGDNYNSIATKEWATKYYNETYDKTNG